MVVEDFPPCPRWLEHFVKDLYLRKQDGALVHRCWNKWNKFTVLSDECLRVHKCQECFGYISSKLVDIWRTIT